MIVCILQRMKAIEVGDGGLVVKLVSTDTKNGKKLRKLECEKFSCFPEEEETLFFGGTSELRIKGIIQLAKGKWMKYDKYMEAVNAINRMFRGLSVKGQVIVESKTIQKRMKRMLSEYLQTMLHSAVQHEAILPHYVFRLVSYQMLLAEHVRLRYNELLSEYQWIRSILVNEDDSGRHLDIVNVAALFSNADSIRFLVDDDEALNEEEWEWIVNSLVSIREMGCSMMLRFEFSSDEDRQDELHQMAMGYLEMMESKWQCRRDGNVLTFNLSADAKIDEKSEAFQERLETILQKLNPKVQIFKQQKTEEDQGMHLMTSSATNKRLEQLMAMRAKQNQQKEEPLSMVPKPQAKEPKRISLDPKPYVVFGNESMKKMPLKYKKIQYRVKNELFVLYDYYQPVRIIGVGTYSAVWFVLLHLWAYISIGVSTYQCFDRFVKTY